jgi:hypothetical protein
MTARKSSSKFLSTVTTNNPGMASQTIASTIMQVSEQVAHRSCGSV